MYKDKKMRFCTERTEVKQNIFDNSKRMGDGHEYILFVTDRWLNRVCDTGLFKAAGDINREAV